ncbi:hypothetical protein Efla_003840 [Eimeria flavescens]
MLGQAGSPGAADPQNQEDSGPLLLEALSHNMRQIQLKCVNSSRQRVTLKLVFSSPPLSFEGSERAGWGRLSDLRAEACSLSACCLQGAQQADNVCLSGVLVAGPLRLRPPARHATAMLAGALAGICGLENLAGFVVYLLLTLLGPLVFLFESNFKLKAFFLRASDPFTASPFGGLLVGGFACALSLLSL